MSASSKILDVIQLINGNLEMQIRLMSWDVNFKILGQCECSVCIMADNQLVEAIKIMHIYDKSYQITNKTDSTRIKFESLKRMNDISVEHKIQQNAYCEIEWKKKNIAENGYNEAIVDDHNNRIKIKTDCELIYLGCIMDLINNYEHHHYNMWLYKLDENNESKYNTEFVVKKHWC